MTIDDIKRIIAPDEHRELELKKTTGELKDGMHSACAFMNTDGGWLMFGITPQSLKIIGQQVTDNSQREISNALSGLEPAVDVHVEYIDVPEHPGNKVIAEVLYKTSWLESWGTGVQRMCDVCKEENVPEPYYVAEQGYVTIVFKKGASATENCRSDCRSQLTERQKKILQMIIDDCSTSATQIAEAMEISVRTTSTEIAVLRKNGFIEKKNKDNRSPWVVLKK